MAIYLIVGQPRHGKSQFSCKVAYECFVENEKILKKIESGNYDPEKDIYREIYSDIDGHAENCEFVKPAPNDWRDVPDNSIIFMDEIHLRPEYCDNDGKMSQNPMIVDLTTHGHQNKDIYLITQDPERLNKGIRKLVQKMYLVKRPIQNPNFATIYEFDRWLRDPWQSAQSERRVHYSDSYKFFFKDKWQNMYKSASAHTSIKFRIQKKFYIAIAAAILLFSGAYYLFTSSGGDQLAKTALGIDQQDSNNQNNSPVTNANAVIKDTDLDKQCRMAANVDKPECIKWFDELTKNNGSVYDDKTGKAVIVYDPSKPFDLESVQKSVSYEVTEKPIFSGCMKKDGKYYGYTQQGTLLNVSVSDCRKLIEEGDRPFNYFREKKNDQLSVQASNTQPDKSTNELYIQEESYQAQNYVEPHLQAKTVNGANQSSFSF